MSTVKISESKRGEFRTYLERSGVIDMLTKALVNLYEEPEKPSNPARYLRRNFDDSAPEDLDVETMRVEFEELRLRIEELEAENTYLKEKLANLQAPE